MLSVFRKGRKQLGCVQLCLMRIQKQVGGAGDRGAGEGARAGRGCSAGS